MNKIAFATTALRLPNGAGAGTTIKGHVNP